MYMMRSAFDRVLDQLLTLQIAKGVVPPGYERRIREEPKFPIRAERPNISGDYTPIQIQIGQALHTVVPSRNDGDRCLDLPWPESKSKRQPWRPLKLINCNKVHWYGSMASFPKWIPNCLADYPKQLERAWDLKRTLYTELWIHQLDQSHIRLRPSRIQAFQTNPKTRVNWEELEDDSEPYSD